MSKFADMMAYLSALDDGFEHVIAVDAGFQTFQRAWVVAEIAQGHEMGLQQHLKLRNEGALHAHKAELRSLDVRNMRSSHPEDAIEILGGILDKDSFNHHLQSMVFNKKTGLLATWKGLDAAQKVRTAGRVARQLADETGEQPPSQRRAE
uniref:Uncharacterized protein n=1 Tax=Alexandrium monilatum TaxID=311494 RepID=A0A7S4ULJ1_9DINO